MYAHKYIYTYIFSNVYSDSSIPSIIFLDLNKQIEALSSQLEFQKSENNNSIIENSESVTLISSTTISGIYV
jgi:hypothetical protein